MYVIFMLTNGQFVQIKGEVVTFLTKGLAYQFMQEKFHIEQVHKTKKFQVELPDYYSVVFKVLRVA